jgi:hypothetical protein
MQGTAAIALVILVPLLSWRVYRRMQRMLGRQRLSRVRAGLTLAIFPVLIGLLAFASHAHPAGLAGLAGGLAVGGVLAVYGLRLTRFEESADGVFYTPSAHLGVALSLLLAGRVLYRLVEVYRLDPANLPQTPDLMLSPVTLAIVGLLAGYYVGYALGLVRWRAPDPA